MKSVKEILGSRLRLIDQLDGLLHRHRGEDGKIVMPEKESKLAGGLRSEIDALNRELSERGIGFGNGEETGPYEQFDPERVLPRQTDPSPLRGEREDAGGVTDYDLALCGWLRNSAGIPVSSAEFKAGERVGIDVRGGAFYFPFPNRRPTLGRNLALAGGARSLAQGYSSDPTGGYTVPEGRFLGVFERALALTAPMLMLAEVIITADGRSMDWPTIDDTAAEGEWLVEHQDSAEGQATVGAYKFGAHKLGSNVLRVSYELLRDSALAVATELGNVLGERLGRGFNRALTTGNGVNRPSGLLTSATVGKTAASATVFTFDELIQLQHSVDPLYRAGPGVGFMMHSDVASFTRRLKDGQGAYLWADSPIAGQPPTLLGDPVYLNQAMSSAMTTGQTVVAYGNLSKMKARLVGGSPRSAGGVRVRILNDLYAKADQTGFVSFMEGDGALLAPSDNAALCPVRVLKLA